MSDIGEGLGIATEGSLLARALEPGSGARAPHPHQPEHCLNCGTGLVGAFCHACGQEAHIHRTIGGFLHDLAHGALHFEGKLWRTLPMVLLRPGKLTRRYVEGARARFVSPMALFLFSVFLMFAVFQVLGISTPVEIERTGEIAEDFAGVGQMARAEADEAREQLEQMAQDDPDRPAAEDRLATAEELLQGLGGVERFALEGDSPRDYATGVSWLDEKILKKWRQNPGLMLYKLQANSYKFSWLLIPLSLPFIWALFAWKRRFRGYDHAIFVTYSLSFMTLLFVALSLLGSIGAGTGSLALAAFVIAPLHIYSQLRGAYSLRRRSAVWRLAVLLLIAIPIIIALFLQILLVLGAF